MGYHATNRMGATIQSPSEAQMRQLLSSLSPDDPEHPDVALTHESEWSIAAFHSGLVVFQNLETGEGPWHMRGLSVTARLGLWQLLAAGDIEQLKQQPWIPGYG